MLSVILNLVTCVLIPGAVVWACSTAPKGQLHMVFRYYTILSNLFCAAVSLAVAVCRLAGGAAGPGPEGALPLGLSLLKFVATAAVTVTMMTVICFLMPRNGGPGELFRRYNFFLHLFCPLLAAVSYLLWDKVRTGFAAVFLGLLPVLLYGAYYLYRVILVRGERKWDDIYGFNRGGKWPVSMAAMIAGTLAVSILLWVI